ncbi:MAG: hypothetical protein ACK5N0_08220 [Synechococcaceae cyanobacterium]
MAPSGWGQDRNRARAGCPRQGSSATSAIEAGVLRREGGWDPMPAEPGWQQQFSAEPSAAHGDICKDSFMASRGDLHRSDHRLGSPLGANIVAPIARFTPSFSS